VNPLDQLKNGGATGHKSGILAVISIHWLGGLAHKKLIHSNPKFPASLNTATMPVEQRKIANRPLMGKSRFSASAKRHGLRYRTCYRL
jgi:hypothetical protein